MSAGRRLKVFSGLVLSSALEATAQSAPANCDVLGEIAQRAYQRIQRANIEALRQERKTAFWDIHEFSKNCATVAILATHLEKAGLAKTSPTPTAAIGILGKDDGIQLPKVCATGGCTFLISEPGKGNSQGMVGINKMYRLEQSQRKAGETPQYEWQELIIQTTEPTKSRLSGTPR